MYRGIGDTLSSIGIGIAFPFCILYRYQKYNFSKCTASKRYYFEIPCYNQRANTSSHCKKELSGIFHTLNVVALAQGKLNKTHIYFFNMGCTGNHGDSKKCSMVCSSRLAVMRFIFHFWCSVYTYMNLQSTVNCSELDSTTVHNMKWWALWRYA